MNHGLLLAGATLDLMAAPLDSSELDDLFSATYEELRGLAARIGARGGETLNPTALVNEAYLRLARSRGLRIESDLHFKRIAARAMRQVLVEAARRRHAQKRGGGQQMVTLDEGLDGMAQTSQEVLALDAALLELHGLAPRQATVVELRFFGGLELTETATLLDLSPATVTRDWRAARAWLARELREAR